MKEQPSAGNLLKPTAAGFVGLLNVLGVRAVLVRLSAYIVELRADTKKQGVVSCGKESNKQNKEDVKT